MVKNDDVTEIPTIVIAFQSVTDIDTYIQTHDDCAAELDALR